jgi:uncharacterized membrane protein YkoI
MPYRELNPRTELEQAVAADLVAALKKRGAGINHYGTPAAHAPASAPCDISVAYGVGSARHTVMVEVAQRNDASEFQSIVSHLDAWLSANGGDVDLLYSGRATSARMARLVRNENERRDAKGIAGRIVFLKFDDLESFLKRWEALPATEAPIAALQRVFAAWRECADDLTAAEVFRREVFPEWTEKRNEIDVERQQRLASQQERLKRDIVRLENQLRDRGITGQRAHKFLIYLFFMALYEDKRGRNTRATKAGFLRYRGSMPAAARASVEFGNRTVHHLLSQDILADKEVSDAGIPGEYVPIELPDDFVLRRVIPVFEEYSFADASIDAIGAVFEALARRAEKDNRIGQFFTPETAVAATCRLAGLRPTDLVADPACGTGRFLIRAMAHMLGKASQVAGKSKDAAERDIKLRQILGCDIDPWISTIAKMNMYIHGDGKSNIRRANGLTLAAIPIFAPFIPTPIVDALDAVVTNPPLGDIDFMAVADAVARDEAMARGETPSEAGLKEAAAKWSSGVFDVVPHRLAEEEEREIAKKKAEEYLEKVYEAKAAGNVAGERRARKKQEEWDKKRQEAEKAIGAGKVRHVPAGQTAKGGALFMSALVKSIKRVRDPGLPLEWRGGVLSMVIDEAVLNTRQYADARKFLRRNYFLKAVVSLPRDAFADLAKTTAKTSILMLVRKEDTAVIQREPVFFARALAAGPSGRDISRRNDLIPICDAFDRWREAVLIACGSSGGALSQGQVAAAAAAMRAEPRPAFRSPCGGSTRRGLPSA